MQIEPEMKNANKVLVNLSIPKSGSTYLDLVIKDNLITSGQCLDPQLLIKNNKNAINNFLNINGKSMSLLKNAHDDKLGFVFKSHGIKIFEFVH